MNKIQNACPAKPIKNTASCGIAVSVLRCFSHCGHFYLYLECVLLVCIGHESKSLSKFLYSQSKLLK